MFKLLHIFNITFLFNIIIKIFYQDKKHIFSEFKLLYPTNIFENKTISIGNKSKFIYFNFLKLQSSICKQT